MKKVRFLFCLIGLLFFLSCEGEFYPAKIVKRKMEGLGFSTEEVERIVGQSRYINCIVNAWVEVREKRRKTGETNLERIKRMLALLNRIDVDLFAHGSGSRSESRSMHYTGIVKIHLKIKELHGYPFGLEIRVPKGYKITGLCTPYMTDKIETVEQENSAIFSFQSINPHNENSKQFVLYLEKISEEAPDKIEIKISCLDSFSYL